MYEIWINQQNPSIHLVKKPETPLPNPSTTLDWVLLGTSRVTPEVAIKVEREGMAEVISVVPFDRNGMFGPGGVQSGTQSTDPI